MNALKWGCGGCLVVIALAALVGGGTVGIAWMQARSSVPEAFEWSADPADRVDPEATSSSEAAEAFPFPVDGSTLLLNFRDLGVEVIPVPPGSTLRVLGDFDPDEFSVVHSSGETEAGAPLETLEIGASGNDWLHALRSLFRPTPELTIEVPVDGFDRLEVIGGAGAGTLDLSGMAFRDVVVYFERGAVQVLWGEPSPRPYESFTVNSIQGAAIVDGLGYAGPKRTEILATMGAAVVDATGPWSQDGTIEMRVKMGGGELVVPRDAEVVGADLPPPRDLDPEIPPVRLELSVEGARDIEIRRAR